MPRLELSGLEHELLRSGISPRHVRRTIAELNDHYDDLYRSAVAAGADEDTARNDALSSMGDLRELAGEMRARPELRSWAFRYPHLALLVYPLTCVAVLPAVPVMMGVAHASQIARWTACLVLSGVVTAAIFIVLTLAVTLT